MIDAPKTSHPLDINHSMFYNNVLTPLESYPSSLVFISLYNPSFKSSVNIYFSNSIFSKTNATRAGSYIYAIDTGLQDGRYKVLKMYINKVTAYNNFNTNYYVNTKTEFMKIVNAKALFNGYNYFINNFGSIFDITNTIISLSGHLNIIGNNGYMGTGFKVKGSSFFILRSGLNATFINNTALTIGGAIYAMADDDFTPCMFQNNTGNANNISMTFIDNTASEAGSSIYSNNLYECNTYNDNTMLDYKKVFSFSSKHRNISMPPTLLCWCDVSCNVTNATIEYNLSTFIRPGQNIELQLGAVYTSQYYSTKQHGYAAVTFLLIDRKNVHYAPSWQVSANKLYWKNRTVLQSLKLKMSLILCHLPLLYHLVH